MRSEDNNKNVNIYINNQAEANYSIFKKTHELHTSTQSYKHTMLTSAI